MQLHHLGNPARSDPAPSAAPEQREVIPVGIVTTRGREEYVERLVERLGDPAPRIYRDVEPGSFANHRAAWRDLLADAPIALLLEDDVWPATNWRPAIELIVNRFRFESLIALWSNRDYTTTPEAAAAGYARRKGGPLTDVATMIWRDTYREFEGWYEHRPWEASRRLTTFYAPGPNPAHDKSLGMFLDDKRRHHVVIVPNVFEHIGIESTEGNAWMERGKPRVSATYPGEAFDVAAHFERIWSQ